MRKMMFAAALATAPLAGCMTYDDPYYAEGDDWGSQYRSGSYEPYAMGHDDQVYRGRDGRYYCRRRDGTVGLVVGGGVGAVLGSAIAGRGSRTLGAIIGGAAGAAAGAAIERGQVQCQ
jgi:outer membrane lipoprotein SlyB